MSTELIYLIPIKMFIYVPLQFIQRNFIYEGKLFLMHCINIVTYRSIARQPLDKQLPADRDSWQTAHCQVTPITIRKNNRRLLLANGRVFREVRREAIHI
jgi:hypothetical protein